MTLILSVFSFVTVVRFMTVYLPVIRMAVILSVVCFTTAVLSVVHMTVILYVVHFMTVVLSVCSMTRCLFDDCCLFYDSFLYFVL